MGDGDAAGAHLADLMGVQSKGTCQNADGERNLKLKGPGEVPGELPAVGKKELLETLAAEGGSDQIVAVVVIRCHTCCLSIEDTPGYFGATFS